MDGETCFFEAVIVPHRSLSARGLRLVVCVLLGLSATVTAVFWWLGAWPVAGFNGVEVGTALLLLRHHARGRRASEVLLLSPQALRIVRIAADGTRTELSLPPAWLRVHVTERPGRVPALHVGSHGRLVEVAASLGEPEKLDLARALRAALEAWRNPRFDGPQRESD